MAPRKRHVWTHVYIFAKIGKSAYAMAALRAASSASARAGGAPRTLPERDYVETMGEPAAVRLLPDAPRTPRERDCVETKGEPAVRADRASAAPDDAVWPVVPGGVVLPSPPPPALDGTGWPGGWLTGCCFFFLSGCLCAGLCVWVPNYFLCLIQYVELG